MKTRLSHACGTALLVTGLAIAGTDLGAADDAPIQLAPAACAGLKDFSIPASAIGLPTSGAVVQTAEPVPANAEKNVNGDFCKVTGIIKNATASMAVFEFEVNLPNTWNGRALQFGGGVIE